MKPMTNEQRKVLNMLKKGKQATTCTNEVDKNNRFVLRKCAIYLIRLLERFPLLDKETVDALFWILGPDLELVGSNLAARVPAGKRRKFEAELQECQADPEEYSDTLSTLIKQHRVKMTVDCRSNIIVILKQRARMLSYRRKSDIEKNVETLRSMLGLTVLMTAHMEPKRDRHNGAT